MTTEKIAVFAPMPSASVRIAAAENAGFLRRPRKPVAEILADRLEEAGRAFVPNLVLELVDAAEAPERLPSGFVRRQSARAVLLDFHLEVEAHLVVELSLDLRPVKEPPEHVANDVGHDVLRFRVRRSGARGRRRRKSVPSFPFPR